MDLQRLNLILEEAIRQARFSQNQALEVAMDNMATVRQNLLTNNQLAILESEIELALLLNDNFHNAINYKPEMTLREIALHRLGGLPHLEVGELPQVLQEDLGAAVLRRVDKIIDALALFQNSQIV